MTEKKKDNENVTNTKVLTFSKRRILEMPEFKNRQDILSVMLDDKTGYSVDGVRKILNEFFVKV